MLETHTESLVRESGWRGEDNGDEIEGDATLR